MPISLITVSNLPLVFNFIVEIFSVVENQYEVNNASPNQLLLTLNTDFQLLLINEKTLPPSVNSNKQFMIEVDDSGVVIEAAVKLGGAIIEEFVQSGSTLTVLVGPENIRIIIADRARSVINGNIFLQWLKHNARDESLKKIEPIDKGWSSPRGMVIPTLYCHIRNENNFMPIDSNSKPIPFKCDIFEGVAALYIRTSPLPQDYKSFFLGNSCTFEVQVQGRFTKMPKGKLYIGAEISKAMNLGMVTRSLCRTILNFARTTLKNPYLHHSFGDDNNQEYPHITASLWSTADRIVVTPPNSSPPALGVQFGEDTEARKIRRSNPLYQPEIDINATYSISTKAKNIELCDWSLSGIPLMNSLDLHTFWSDSDLKLCCYAVESSEDLPEFHYQKNLEYCFAIELRHNSNHPEWRENNGIYDPLTDCERRITESLSVAPNSATATATTMDSFALNDEHDDEDEFFDAEQGQMPDDDEDDDDEKEKSRDFDERITLFCSSNESKIDNPNKLDEIKLSSSSLVNLVDLDIFQVQIVSSVIQVYDVRFLGTGKRRDLFVLSVPIGSKMILSLQQMCKVVLGLGNESRILKKVTQILSTLPEIDIRNSSKSENIWVYDATNSHVRISSLCSYTEFEGEFRFVFEEMKTCKNFERFSKTEQRRYELNYAMQKIYDMALQSDTIRLQLLKFLLYGRHMDNLLEDKISQDNKTKSAAKDTTTGTGTAPPKCDVESAVLLRVGQTHWSEEYLILDANEMTIVKPKFTSNRFRIPITEIMEAKILEYKEFSLPDFFILFITTFCKVYTFVIRGTIAKDKMVQYFQPYLARMLTRSISASYQPVVANSTTTLGSVNFEMLSRPSDWKLGDRVILNGRIYCGRLKASVDYMTLKTDARVPQSETFIAINPVDHVVETLDKLLFLCNDENRSRDVSNYSVNDENTVVLRSQWISFLDSVALLSIINLSEYSLSENDRICIFVNLYHILVLHSFLVVGIPTTLLKWPSFFNSCSYEAFGDIFSIAELEHCIIKAGEFNRFCFSILIICRNRNAQQFFCPSLGSSINL